MHESLTCLGAGPETVGCCRRNQAGDAGPMKAWLGRKDSNPRMPESKSGALTNLATPQRVTGKPSDQVEGAGFGTHCNTFRSRRLPGDNNFFADPLNFLEQGQSSGMTLCGSKHTGTGTRHADGDGVFCLTAIA